MPKDKLSLLLGQLKSLLKYTKGIPLYDPIAHGQDFTQYCESHTSSNSLTSQNPETPFGFKTYDRPYLFYPLYTDLNNGEENLFQQIPDQTYVEDFENIVLQMPTNSLYDVSYSQINNMENFYVSFNDTGYFFINKTVVQDRVDSYLCFRGYQYWFRKKINFLISNTGNTQQLYNYLSKFLIPELPPIDQQIFMRWCAAWILSAYDDGSGALDRMICDATTALTCSNTC